MYDHKGVRMAINVYTAFNAPWQKHVNPIPFNLDLANALFSG